MLWSDFLNAVNSCLGPDGVRRGIEGFRTQHISNALADLQRYIPSMRTGNVTVFNAGDLTLESRAMVGAMPIGAKVKAFYIYSNAQGDDPNCKRYRLDYYPWSKRSDIVCGRLDYRTWWGGCCQGIPGICPPPPSPPSCPNSLNPWSWCEERAYVYSISPHLDNFLIHPKLNAYDSLMMVWDGFKTTFNPTDVVPYPPELSEAVAAYVQSKIRKVLDRDRALAQDSEVDYITARRSLMREYRDNLVTDGQDDEYLSNLVAPPGQSFISAGAQALALLQNITQLLGTTPNSLQALPTQGLTTPITVLLLIGGIETMWTLKVGADGTDVPNGIVRPNDWATSGLVWYQETV